MKRFTKAISELKFTLGKLIIFDTIINSILIFLATLILVSLFGVSFIYPLFLAVAYFVFVIFRRLRLNKITLVEKKYSNMDEKLRTATEYESSGNPVVKELQSEVVRSMKRIEESAFVNERKIYLKSIGIIGLCFLLLVLSPVTFGIPGFGSPGDALPDPGSIGEGAGDLSIRFSGSSLETGLMQISEDFYAEPTVAVMGGEEIKVRITPSGRELNVRQIHEADPPSFSESFPVEVQAVTAESYKESIAKEDLELVKDYFNKLAEG